MTKKTFMGDHDTPFVVSAKKITLRMARDKEGGLQIVALYSKAADAIDIDLIDDVRDQFGLASTDSVILDPKTFRRFLGACRI